MLLDTLLFNKPHQQNNGYLKRVTTIKEKHVHIAQLVVANLLENITNLLQSFKVTAVHGWNNSMVVLHCLEGNSTYKQFVHNRIDHINSKPPIQWHYVSTDKNLADTGSRRCNTEKLPKKWLKGPTWLYQRRMAEVKRD